MFTALSAPMSLLFSAAPTRLLQALTLLILCVSLTACDGDDGPAPPMEEEPTSIAELVSDSDNLSTLASAVEAADLVDALSGDNPLTVFAPEDDAFDALTVDALLQDENASLLAEVLQYHVVSGAALAGDLSDGDVLTTLQGDELRVSVTDGTVQINGATVTQADIEADNGVVHVIDGVLLENRSALERLSVTEATQTLAGAVEAAGLTDAVNSAENWTVFAPIEDAFAGVDASAFSETELAEILQYHILPGDMLIASGNLVSQLEANNGEISVPTLQGESITFRLEEDGSIVLNSGQATLLPEGLDIYTDDFTNVAHLIDGVLLPDALRPTNRAVSYALAAQPNNGAIPSGVNGTATFWELNDTQTVVTLELTNGATGTDVSHPAHIHVNSAEEGGGIEYYLSPIDGSGGGGTSARVVDVSFDALTSFDGHINIHESVANLGTIVSQGNIGANAMGTDQEGLTPVPAPRSTEYALAANTNDGAVPDGVPATATFLELTEELTLVTLALDIDGATGLDVSHPAHIHVNSASEGGGIEYYLSPIDGSDADARSSKIVSGPYSTLVNFDGHINIHESVANLGTIVSRGNIGANAEDSGSSGGNTGY